MTNALLIVLDKYVQMLVCGFPHDEEHDLHNAAKLVVSANLGFVLCPFCEERLIFVHILKETE